jgi:hypothetical protein
MNKALMLAGLGGALYWLFNKPAIAAPGLPVSEVPEMPSAPSFFDSVFAVGSNVTAAVNSINSSFTPSTPAVQPGIAVAVSVAPLAGAYKPGVKEFVFDDGNRAVMVGKGEPYNIFRDGNYYKIIYPK